MRERYGDRDEDDIVRDAFREAMGVSLRFGLAETVAKSLMLKREGYSSSGIARLRDMGESTVTSHLNDAEDELGPEALWPYHKTAAEDPLQGRSAQRLRYGDSPESDDAPDATGTDGAGDQRPRSDGGTSDEAIDDPLANRTSRNGRDAE